MAARDVKALADLAGGHRGTPRKKERAVRHVVILGGGAVGAAIAFQLRREHLSRQSQRKTALRFDLQLTIVECAAAARRCPCGELGCDDGSLHALGANCGSSSGWLAKDACDGTPMETLAREGFDAHVALGEDLENSEEDQVDYRRLQHVVHSATIGSRFGREQPVYERPAPKPWAEATEGGEVMSGSTFCKACSTAFAAQPFSPESGGAFGSALPCACTAHRENCSAPMPAQINPRKLCWALAKQAGAVVVSGTEAVGVITDDALPKAKVKAVRVRPASAMGVSPSVSAEPEPEPELEPEAERPPKLVAGQSVWPPEARREPHAHVHAQDIESSLSSGQLGCTDVVVACGPWSAVASTEAWFGNQGLQLPLTAVGGQSMIVRCQEEKELLIDLGEDGGDEPGPQAVAISGVARELVMPPPLPIRTSMHATKVNEVYGGGRSMFVPFVLPRPVDTVREVWVGGASEPMGSVMKQDRNGVPRMTLDPPHVMTTKCSAVVIGALRGAAVEVAPTALAEAEHVRQLACVRSHTPDGMPALGAVQRCGE
jgi:glycine/D-amino acid oxidase-like deaminating enzyme